MDEATQQQTTDSAQPDYAEIAKTDGDVSAVAQLLRAQIEPEEGAPAAGEQPAAGGEAGEQQEEIPGLSEEGLGMQPAGGDTDGLTQTLQSLAEKSGLDLKELYAVAVPLGDGREATTLGGLKDQFQEYSRLVEKTEAFEENRTEFENNMIRSRAELQQIIAKLPAESLSQELLAEVASEYAETRQREQTALLSVKPDWKDPAAYALAQDQILETASEYGFTRHDLNAVIDHRLIKLLHDFHVMRVRFKDANAGLKRVVEASRQPRAKRARGAPAKELKTTVETARKPGASSQDKAAAIAAVIRSSQT